MTDERPKWECNLSEDEFEWLLQSIVKITHHREMTGNDTSEEWIELHTVTEKRKFHTNFLDGNGLFHYEPNWRELVQLTWKGEKVLERLEEIQVWEKKNQRERAEYERLKKKFNND